MHDSPWVLFTIAVALGLRHGFDLDHLATIDAITRAVNQNGVISKYTGCLFSLGHGMVVTIISILIGSGLLQSHFPLWLESVGNSISIFFLFTFGILTLWQVMSWSDQQATISLQTILSRKLIRQHSHPFIIILIGALFAFSFDTFTQVALFSLSASLLLGWGFAGILGLAFMMGMMLADGFNGLFIFILIKRAGIASAYLSRIIGLLIAGFSLSVGTLSILRGCR